MPIDEPTLSKLLRLKRHEQPPTGYFDDFLREFQRRQRAELLRRPFWRILLDRFELFRGEYLTLPRLSYAMASAAVLCVAAMLTWTMIQHPGNGMRGSMIAALSNEPASQIISQETQGMGTALTPQIRIPDALLEATSLTPAAARQYPRYILDTRPASYEPPFSF